MEDWPKALAQPFDRDETIRINVKQETGNVGGFYEEAVRFKIGHA